MRDATQEDPLDDFARQPFEAEGATRRVYVKGTGPAVVLMHEVPGITPAVATFARRVVDAGFTVYLPHLFGHDGCSPTLPYVAGQLVRACVAREFTVLARHQSSPVTKWLRALCRHAHAACGGPGVGALGMCLTGNFALALMVEPAVMAPVLSQPSLPFPITAGHRAALHLSPPDLQVVQRRAAAGVGVLGLRFTHDSMCPGARFETLRQTLGQGFEDIEIDSSPGNAAGNPPTAHSVLTEHLVDQAGHPTRQALDRVLAFFDERLRPSQTDAPD